MSSKWCFLVLALLLASATLSLGWYKDPEQEQQKCREQCRVQSQYDEQEARRCIQQYCGGGRVDDDVTRRGPEERLKECRQRCSRKQGEEWERCQRQCQSEYERERGRHGGNDEREWEGEGRRERETEQEQGRNPYVFEDRHFFTGLQTQHGRLRILQKFNERSELLRGIENYRVAILEAQPQTFIVPSHWDAETVVFVANGRGTVSSVIQESSGRESRSERERRESFNIEEGDVFRVEAGTTTYLINRDNNEKLVLVKLVLPVNTPGEFEAFYGAGGENPESFYRAFSNEILEAALNTRSDKLERVLGQQKQGAIIKASEEQLRRMSHQDERGGVWPFGGESKGRNKHNLYEHRSAHSNQHGQLYEIDSKQFRQLRDLNLAVSLANISRGAMTALQYNSRATKIMVVVDRDSEGYFEMACPHLSQSEGGRRRQQQGKTGYQKVRANLRVGTVVVVPAGHPFVAVASNNKNLKVLCFEINAYNNQRYTLTGKGNVIRQLEREAKELAFGVPAKEVDDLFDRQQEEFFTRGPRQQHQGHADA